jgi:hypothetical protein
VQKNLPAISAVASKAVSAEPHIELSVRLLQFHIPNWIDIPEKDAKY